MLVLQAKHSLNLGADVISLFEMTQHALNLLKPLKAYSGIITATLILGYIAREQGDFKKATNLFKEALRLARQHSSPQDIGQCLNWLCSTQKNIDTVSNTTKLMRESIEELKQLGDQINLGFGLFIFGSFLTQNHQLEEAERLLKESLEIEQQSHFFAIPVQIELARLALQHQDLDKAQVLLKQGFEKASKIGDEFSKQNALSMLGKIKLKQGQLQEAEQLLTQSLKGSWEQKMLLATSRALVYIAELGFALENDYYSLVLLSFLKDYPAITKQDKEETKKLLTVKTASLSTSEVLRVKKQAKTLDIEDVVYSVLGENKFKFAIGD
jgi:tetratricopeptide (TPR) repeat protein